MYLYICPYIYMYIIIYIYIYLFAYLVQSSARNVRNPKKLYHFFLGAATQQARQLHLGVFFLVCHTGTLFISSYFFLATKGKIRDGPCELGGFFLVFWFVTPSHSQRLNYLRDAYKWCAVIRQPEAPDRIEGHSRNGPRTCEY